MAEEHTPAPLVLPTLPLEGLTRNRYAAFALQWYGIVLAGILALVSALIFVTSADALRPLFDDSYISLTFARNIAEHGKLSFDGQHWSTGATSPLHVLILALFLKLGAAPFFTSIAVGVAGSVLLAVGVYLMSWAIFRNRPAALLSAAAISFMVYVPLDAGNGLETTLFMALVAFAAASYFLGHRRRARLLTGVLIGLAVLTRPEGALLIPAFVAYRWIEREEGESLREFVWDAALLALPGVIAAGGLALYSLIVSDSLSGTANAKLQFFQEDQQPLEYKVSVASDQIALFISPLIPLIILAALAVRRREALLAALFWLPVLAVYTDLFPGGLAHYFYRYQHPILPFLAAFAGGGAAYLIAAAWKRDVVVRGLTVLALAALLFPMYKQYERWHHIYREGSIETKRDLESMALDLNTIIKPDETLATHDIGAVGYFADYKVLDLVGLVNQEVIDFQDGRRLSQYLDLKKPDYVLIFPDWDTFFLHFDAADHPERFELVKTYPGGEVREQPYLLYRVHYD